MIKIAITGGIGSGKTTVCRMFNLLGIPVFYADFEAKKIMSKDLEVKMSLINFFGDEIYRQNGELDRKKLADIIFNDKIALENVNKIVHPAVHRYFDAWAIQQQAPYVIEESAIVIENRLTHFFDFVVLVTSPFEEKLKRVVSRDGSSEKAVIERMNNQMSDEMKATFSNYIIQGGDDHFIIPQVIEIHKNILEYGKIW